MDEELDGALGTQADLVPISDLINATKEPGVDIRNLSYDINKVAREKYDGAFSHLSKPELRSFSQYNSPYVANKHTKRPEVQDVIKDASNNSVWEKLALDSDGNEMEFNPAEWQDSPLADLGFNDIMYERKRPGTGSVERESLDAVSGVVPGAGLISSFTEKFDDQQEYDYLTPSINPKTGKPILKVVSGTRDQVVKDGYNLLNKYGLQSESDNPVVALLKGFSNTLGETDDLLISAAKYAQDLGKFGYNVATGEEVGETGLDEVYEETKDDTHRGNFLASKDSEDFGSVNWFASGSGSAFGSLLQFGGVGRAVRGGVAAIDAIGMAVGKKAMKQVVYGKVASYGSSGIIGFGHGYDEAVQNGLPDGEALLFGTLVGAINAAIEVKLGKDFDNFLTGGGTKSIAKDIYKELGGEVTEASTKKFMKEKAKDIVASAPGRFRNMGIEGSEEVLQDIVEQSARLTYNAFLADDDAEDFKGKFNQKEYSFIQTVSAGIFGAIAASPFNTTRRKMASYIMDGKGKEVRNAVEKMATTGKITSEQKVSLTKQADKIEEAFELNKNLFQGLSGEFAENLKFEAMDMLSKRKDLEIQKDKVLEGLQNNPEKAEEVKTQRESFDKQIQAISEQIEKYSKPDFLQERVQKYKKAKESQIENRNNVFSGLASLADYTTDQSEEDSKERIGKLTADGFKYSALVRTADEAAFVLKSLPGLDASLAPVLKNQMEGQKFHLSPKVNTMENRQALLDLGFNEEQLPLTPEEHLKRATNPEEFVRRHMTNDQFQAIAKAIKPEEIDLDPELARQDKQYTEYDQIKYLMKNRAALGITDAMLHSLDSKSALEGLLTGDQVTAIGKVLDMSLPASIILNQAAGDLKGVYHKETGAVVINGDINGKKGKNLFHVLAHEVGHGVFDREVELTFSAWRRVVNNRRNKMGSSAIDTVNFEYFDRLLKLAGIAYESKKGSSKAKRLYFYNTIGENYSQLGTNEKIDGSLSFVKEFFAEAFSNVEFQEMLDSFDLNDPKNKGIMEQFNYTYTPIVAQKESLLSQVLQAVSSVFSRLGNILSRKDRTILTEAFTLGSNLQFNKFVPSRKEVEKHGKAIIEMSFSAFDPINLYEGETVDPDKMLATIYERIDRAKIELTQNDRDQLLGKLKEFVKDEITHPDAAEYLKGSMLVVFFKNTDNFMISWKTADDTGDQIHRTFVNKRGGKVLMNTDVANFRARTTLSKHDAFNTFHPTSKGEEYAKRKEILNNLDRALQENFSGDTHLEFDEDKVWKFKGQDIRGQVSVIYTFQDGKSGIVGYTPDMTKVRLAHMISNGSSIKVQITRDGKGSDAWVKRDENGVITEVYRTTDKGVDRTGMKLEESFMPAMSFRYLPSSIITEEAKEVADRVDTITPDNPNLEPKVSKMDLFAGWAKGFDGDSFPEFSLYDETAVKSPVRVQPGTVEDKVQYIRDGLGRYLKRSLHFMNRPIVNDDYDNLVTEYFKKAEVQYADDFGFETNDEFLDFAKGVIEDVSRDFRVKGKQKRDREDYSGMGGNPSGRISVAIKADLEALNFLYDGKKHWVDFGEAKDMLVEAAGRASDFPSMVQELLADINRGIFAGREKEIAVAVYKHLSKDRSADNAVNNFFHSIENSYYSQFGSYIRLDAITFAPQDESAFLYFNGEKSYLKQFIGDFTGTIIQKINAVRDMFPDEENATAVYKNMKQDMTSFMRDRYTEKGLDAATIDSYLANQNGSQSTVIDRLRQEMKAYQGNPNKFFNTKGYTKDGVAFNRREAYDKMVALVDSYFAYFGIELPAALLNLELNEGNVAYRKQVKEQLMKEGKSDAEVSKIMNAFTEGLNINKYHLVAFKDSKTKEYGEYPFMVLANQVADWLTVEVEKTIKNDPKADLAISELDTFVKILTKQAGNYRSPEFYFNAEFNKEWSLKTRAYLDDLVSDLTTNQDGLLDTYMNASLYKNNRFLQSIKASKGQPVQFMISGINGAHNSSASKSYENASDLDYLYMNLAGFVHSANNPFYYHIDDVPSDKPRNMAFRMGRIHDKELKSELEKIYETETQRIVIANDRFFDVFEVGDKKGEYTLAPGKESALQKLIPGVHYVDAGNGIYNKGRIFNKDLYFYGHKKADQVAKIIEQESIASFNEFQKKGMSFPVSTQFVKELKQKELSEDDYKKQLIDEQRRVFSSWRNNYIVNRYHLNQVIMGDYMYYKADEFTDLNKRHAGTSAPFSRAVQSKPRTKVAILKDASHETPDGKVTLVKTMKNDAGKWVVNEDDVTDLTNNTNRTDAQGYVTEQYAAHLQAGYGAFSGYEKVFKPVMFGVSKDMIEYAQPLYLKLSLAVLPDPANAQNVDYFEQYPEQLVLAQKLYASGADFGVFESGVKVGINTINLLESDTFETMEFDSNLMGLQNNPYHDPNADENTLSGLVQMMKILGDNANMDLMKEYYEIEGKLVDQQVQKWLDNKFSDDDTVRETVKERLARNEYSSPIADFVDAEVRVLDNPTTAKFAENLFNADFKDAVALFPKNGEKLVNLSDYGYARPRASEAEMADRARILGELGITDSPYDDSLRWVGPRRPQDLTPTQLSLFHKYDIEKYAIDEESGYIMDDNGDVVIFPAEALVPPGDNYKIGDRMISVRIPTSKKSNLTPTIVVGFLAPQQGNVIVLGKHVTGVHGLDFDVDGLFVWRERQHDFNKSLHRMFQLGYTVLTHPRNYNDITSPVTTDTVQKIVDDIAKLNPDKGMAYSKFSPERQLQLKKLNSGGKRMLSISAVSSGIHSVLAQNNGSPFIDSEIVQRAYMYEGKLVNRVETKYTDRDGNEVLISDVYSEFINSSADNAKLQQVGRLNINPTTGSVLFDMISHGISMEYATYFINQPVIREYVARTETQQAASFRGESKKVHMALMAEYENRIKAIPGFEGYSYNGRTGNGATDPKSKAISHFVADKNKFKAVKSDKVSLSFAQLEDGIKGRKPASFIKVYQGYNDAVDQRDFNYYSTSENEARTYGKNIRIADIDLTSFLRKLEYRNGSVEWTKEFTALNKEFKNQGGLNFDILDNSQSGIANQESFFRFIQEKGYKGYTELMDNYRSDENNYVVEFKNSESTEKLLSSPAQQLKDFYEQQIVVMDKFMFYKELASVTKNAGRLVKLTSSYPKTFIELVDTRERILDAAGRANTDPTIDINGLLNEHGMYRVHWRGLNDLIDHYSGFKFYANPSILEVHADLTRNKSVDLQQKVADDFYTFLLTKSTDSDNEANVYNLSTSSLTGVAIDPYHFVNESAIFIAELKKQLPGNEFLRVLSVKIEGTEEQWADKAIKPNQVDAKLLYEPAGELLQKIRDDFRALPADFNGVKSVKDVILGHLLYTQGFGLGGFNFSKILPEEVVKSFDQTIQLEVDSFEAAKTMAEAKLDPAMGETISGMEVLEMSDLAAFPAQVKMNHPQLIREVSPEDLQKAIKTPGRHFDFWANEDGMNSVDKGAVYQGAMKRVTRADGGEDIQIQYKKAHAENNRLVRQMKKEGLVRIDGKVFEVTPDFLSQTIGKYTAVYIELKEINLREFKNLKQYGESMYYADKSASLVKGKSYEQIDEELSEEPEALPVYTFKHLVVPGEINIADVRSGKQTAIIVDAAPELAVGQSIQIPHDEGFAVVRVKRVHELAKAFAQGLKARNGDEAKTLEAFSNWLIKVGQPTEAGQALTKGLIEFTYEASLSLEGFIEQSNVDFNDGPISEFSEYNERKAAGLYKTIAAHVATKLKTIPNLPYKHDVHAEFLHALRLESFKFGPLEIQIIEDHLNHYGVLETDTDEIAKTLEELSQIPNTIGLEHYNTADVWERDEQSPLEVMYDVGAGVFGPKWFDELALDFTRVANEIIDEALINPVTGKPETHFELLEKHYFMYQKERRMMAEIRKAVEDDNGVNKLTTKQLEDYMATIGQMNAADGLMRKKADVLVFIETLGHKIGNRYEGASFSKIQEKNPGESSGFGQKDIGSWDEYLVHITDFTERQAAMQHIGRLVDIAEIKSNMEKMNTIAAMNRLMGNVISLHYAHKPKSWIEKVQRWKYSSQTRDAFDWMFEGEGSGKDKKHTGQMVLRYEATEAKHKADIDEHKKDADGRDLPQFVISNRKAAMKIEKLFRFLNDKEKARFQEIMIRYNDYESFYEQYQLFNEEEQKQSARDTTYLRKLYVKANVRSKDSQLFKDLKLEAKQYAGTVKGDLAQAKIDLYDFLYEKSTELMSDTGNEHSPVERGLMPQTKMNFEEMVSRYGFRKAKKLFLTDTQDDMDRIETNEGVVVRLFNNKSFENSKTVPYRTLRAKEHFSVNAPTIFAHHFNTLIFKKHYDPVLPAMDAVQQHYIMKQKSGVENYDNLVKYITDFANQHIFYKKSNMSKSKAALIGTAMSSMAVTTFLGIAPLTSAINALVGLTESYKHMQGDYGFTEGSKKFSVGLSRTLTRKGIIKKKAMAIMNYYGIETYSTSEIQQADDFIGEVQDKLLFLQKRSEIVVRASSLLAEMTEEQWNSFTLNPDGTLTVDEANAPNIENVSEWLNRIGTIQGKYGIKRLYHNNPIYKNAMLFKGWLIDYVRSRTGKAHFNQWGNQREGYYRTVSRLLTTGGANRIRLLEYYGSMFGAGTNNLTPLEQQNIRKIHFDALLMSMFLLLQGALGEDDKEETWYLSMLAKMNSQLFLLTDPGDMIRMVKNPFAGLHTLETVYKLTDHLMRLQFKKAAESGYDLVPGKQIWDPTIEAMMGEEE